MDDTLDGCIRKFMSISPSQQHLYEIHTSPQPPLVTAVMSADHVVQLARLQDCFQTGLENAPITDEPLRLKGDFVNVAAADNIAVPATEPRLAIQRERAIEIADRGVIHQGAKSETLLPNAPNNSPEVAIAGHRAESIVGVLSDTRESVTSLSPTKSQPVLPERSIWR